MFASRLQVPVSIRICIYSCESICIQQNPPKKAAVGWFWDSPICSHGLSSFQKETPSHQVTPAGSPLPGAVNLWIEDTPVFGASADGGKWQHPPRPCGRDMKPVPAGRSGMWNCNVESRTGDHRPQVGSRHPCDLGWSSL